MRDGPWLLAMLFAVAAVGVSVERLRRVHRASSFDLPALTRALGLRCGAPRLGEMRELMLGESGASWESELVRVVLEARSPAERTALVNEQLGEVESELRWGSRIPAVAARLSAVGPLCVLFFVLATGGVELGDIIPVIAWGGAGVVGALAVGREADRVATDVRKGIDTWVGRVLDAASADESP